MKGVDKTKQLINLSNQLKEARIQARLSQTELAQAIGVSDKSVSAYEKGRVSPSFEQIQKIAQVTNQTLAFFAGEDQKITVETKMKDIEKQLSEIKKLLKSPK